MALLERDEDGVRFPLISRTLIGRSHACLVRLSSPRVSSVHAELTWDGQYWFVHDLGSRNGTYVDGQAVEPRKRVRLSEGSTLVFGNRSERFVLSEDSPPTLVIEGVDGRIVSGSSAMICVPSDERPLATVLRDSKGAWQLETELGVEPVTEQTMLDADGTHWRIHVPDVGDFTQGSDEQPLDTESIALEFQVSRDEEHVEIAVVHGGVRTPLPSRAHDFFLLTLARTRMSDQERSDIDPAEHGWIYREEIIGQLKIERHLLNLWTHRARRQFADIGLVDPGNLIERRPRSEQIRLGIATLRVSRS